MERAHTRQVARCPRRSLPAQATAPPFWKCLSCVPPLWLIIETRRKLCHQMSMFRHAPLTSSVQHLAGPAKDGRGARQARRAPASRSRRARRPAGTLGSRGAAARLGSSPRAVRRTRGGSAHPCSSRRARGTGHVHPCRSPCRGAARSRRWATEELSPEERTRQLCRSATSPGHSSSVSIMVACSPSRVRSGGRG